MNAKFDSNFIFISSYEVIIFAANMIICLILVFTLDQAYFEIDAKNYVWS